MSIIYREGHDGHWHAATPAWEAAIRRAAVEFFTELGLELEGRAPVEGGWADGVTGLRDMRVEIAMMRTPDGHNRLELSRFLAPPVVARLPGRIPSGVSVEHRRSGV